jgi:hypothetical protein
MESKQRDARVLGNGARIVRRRITRIVWERANILLVFDKMGVSFAGWFGQVVR